MPIYRTTDDVSGLYKAISKIILFLGFHKSESSPNNESGSIETPAQTHGDS
jgi:hypothetical protein